MKLKDILKESEDRGLTNEVKKHFLEIVSTYNKYQESMDRKSDIIEVAETLGGITEAARELALREADDWFDKHTIKRNMSELNKLGTQFDKVAKEARNLDQRLNGLYEDMGNILSRYYKIGEITEDEMKRRLGIKEGKGDCGCGCGGVTEGGCGDKSSKLNDIKNEVLELDKDEMAKLHNDGEIEKDGEKIVFKNEDVENEKLLSALKDKLSDEGGAAGFKDLQDKAKEMGVDLTADMLKGMDGISQHRDGDYILDGFASDAQRRAAFASGYKAKGKKGKKKNELKVFGEKVTKLIEKNVPTNPSKWAYYKAQAK